MSCKSILVHAIMFFSALSGSSATAADSITETDIAAATCSLRTIQVLGWEYYATSSQVWERGIAEPANVGEITRRAAPTSEVRAVGLGVEGDCVVLLTLRSFVDAMYPNPFIQGVSRPIKDQHQTAIPFDRPGLQRADWIRYGRIDLTWYRDTGGGALSVVRKVAGLSECDSGAPVRYESIRWGAPDPEVFEGGSYPRPHERVSVSDHFVWQRLYHQMPIGVRTFAPHDVALLYIPKGYFTTGGIPPTLGLLCPSAAVDSMLNRSKTLFGFEFALVGKETMERLRSYTPTVESVFPGMKSLADIADLVFGIDTLAMIKGIDGVLAKEIPGLVAAGSATAAIQLMSRCDPVVLRKVGLLALGMLSIP